MTWEKSRDGRKRVFVALSTAGKPLSCTALSVLAGKSPSVTYGMLNAFREEEIAERVRAGKVWLWKHTGKPLQAAPSRAHAAIADAEASRYQYRELDRACAGLRIVRFTDEERA